MADPYAAFSATPPGAVPAPVAGAGEADPYAAFTAAPPPPRPPAHEVGRLEATGRGALDMASFGFEPALTGAAAAGGPRPSTIAGRASGAAAARPVRGAAAVAEENSPTGRLGVRAADILSPSTWRMPTWGDITDEIEAVRQRSGPAGAGMGQRPTTLGELVGGRQEGPATKAYRQGREKELEENEQAFEQHPGYYIGGQIGGALAMPMGAVRGGTLLERVGSAAKSGAIAGAVSGAGGAISGGGGVSDAAAGAAGGGLLGAVLGGAGSAAIEGGARAVNKLGRVWRGATDTDLQAARDIASVRERDLAAGSGGVEPSVEAAANRAGLRLANIDYGGQTTLDLGRTAANVSPEAWSRLEELTTERTEARPQRISNFINRLFGGRRLDAGADQAALQAEARRANAPAYQRAYEAGDRPVWSPEMERLVGASPSIRAAMGSAIRSGQDRAAEQGFGAFNPGVQVTPDGRLTFPQGRSGAPVYPNIQFWDYVQRDLADMVEKVQGREPDKARYLNSLHQQLNTELDRLVPEFQNARVGAWRYFQAQDASEAGRRFVMMNADSREAARQLAAMTAPDRQLFARGFADELSQSVLKLPNTMATIKRIFTSPAAAEKIRVALGAPRAREIETLMRAEAIAQKSKDALGNSTTARQAEMIRHFRATGLAHGAGGFGAGAGAIGLLEFLKDGDFDPKSVLSTALVFGAFAAGAHRVDTRVMRRIGEMLASDDPSIVRQGTQAVAHSPTLFNALRRGTEAGARVTARNIGFNRALAGSAAVLSDILAHEEEHHHAAHPDNQQAAPLQ